MFNNKNNKFNNQQMFNRANKGKGTTTNILVHNMMDWIWEKIKVISKIRIEAYIIRAKSTMVSYWGCWRIFRLSVKMQEMFLEVSSWTVELLTSHVLGHALLLLSIIHNHMSVLNQILIPGSFIPELQTTWPIRNPY